MEKMMLQPEARPSRLTHPGIIHFGNFRFNMLHHDLELPFLSLMNDGFGDDFPAIRLAEQGGDQDKIPVATYPLILLNFLHPMKQAVNYQGDNRLSRSPFKDDSISDEKSLEMIDKGTFK